MGKVAKKTLALIWSLCTLLLLLPDTAQAYSFSEAAGSLSVSYKSEIVVPKGQSANLSVSASTSDGHAITYQWSEMTATGKTDKDGYALWRLSKISGATGASYSVANITENKSYACKVSCDSNSTLSVYEDVYAADVLQLDVPFNGSKNTDSYQESYFVFTPSSSGTYVFSSSGTVEARLSIFGELEINSNNLISDYESKDSGKGGTATVELKSGKTYAVQAYIGASENGSYSITVQKYSQTSFSLTSKQTSYNVDKKSASTTMKVSASGKTKTLGTITYQWYQYDPVEWDYVPISGATKASYTVSNSSLKWIENNFRCDATNTYGETNTVYFKLYHDTDWYAYSNGSDERVTYNASATLTVSAGQTNAIYNEYGEWISEEFVENSKGKTYQWYELAYDSSYYDGDKFVAIANATASEYKTGAVKENKRYLCVIKDSDGICDYRQFYVRPSLMSITVDQTYYSVDDGGDVSVKILASAKESNTTFDYYWYKGTEDEQSASTSGASASLDYTEIDRYKGKSSVRLTDVTETQYLKCEVWASTEKAGVTLSDYVEIDFVIDPGTGYDQMYTTSYDKNVKGASVQATSTTTKNKDGTYTTVTTSPDGTMTKSLTEKNKDGSMNIKVNSEEVNASGNMVKLTIITSLSAEGKVTGSTETHEIAKAESDASATVTVSKDKNGKATSASAEVTLASKNKKATITKSLVKQIKEAADGLKSVDVTMQVTDKKGNARYTVIFDTADMTAETALCLFRYDEKGDTLEKVGSKKFTVSGKGSLTVSASSNATYVLATKESNAWKLLGEIRIADEETPLAAAEDSCYIHWIILLLTLAAGIFGVTRFYERRRKKAGEESSQEA